MISDRSLRILTVFLSPADYSAALATVAPPYMLRFTRGPEMPALCPTKRLPSLRLMRGSFFPSMIGTNALPPFKLCHLDSWNSSGRPPAVRWRPPSFSTGKVPFHLLVIRTFLSFAPPPPKPMFPRVHYPPPFLQTLSSFQWRTLSAPPPPSLYADTDCPLEIFPCGSIFPV